jgi:hypothetical protein
MKHYTSKNTRGPKNPAGSKMLRRFYKAKKAERGTYAEAVNWNNTRRD